MVLSALRVVSAQSTAGNGRLATLQGMVSGFDQEGDRMPLSWVRVNATSRPFNLTVYTGLNGLYVMVLPPGTYRITTFIQGYSSQSTNVTVAAGQFLLHDFMLRSVYAVSPSPHHKIANETGNSSGSAVALRSRQSTRSGGKHRQSADSFDPTGIMQNRL